MAAFGIKAIHPADATHILGHASPRTGASESLLEIWNGATSGTVVVTVTKEGNIRTGEGTQALPALCSITNPDTGFFFDTSPSEINVTIDNATELTIDGTSCTIVGELNHDGAKVGLYGTAPVVQATGYTAFSNLSTDRTCDADSTSVAELADILGTLIEDLKLTGIIAVS